MDLELALESLEQGLFTGFGIALVATGIAIVVMFLDGRK